MSGVAGGTHAVGGSDSYMDSFGNAIDADDRGGGMMRSHEKSNVQAFSFGDGEADEVVAEKAAVEFRGTLKCVILATTFGKALAQECISRGMYTHLVRSVRGAPKHVTKPLMEINDLPLIDYWINALKACARLQPLAATTYVLCNDDNIHEFKTWLENSNNNVEIPEANIISTGSSQTLKQGPVKDLATFAELIGLEDNLLVIDGDHVFEPEFNLQRFVEHATVRGRDCVAFKESAADSLSLGGFYKAYPSIELDAEGSPYNPPLRSVQLLGEGGAAQGEGINSMCPLYMLRRGTVAMLKDYPEIPAPECINSLSHLMRDLLTSRPVYGIPVSYCFNVRNLDDFLYTDNFFEFYSAQKRKVVADRKVQDTDSHLDFKTEYSGSEMNKRDAHEDFSKDKADTRRSISHGALDVAELLVGFNQRYFSGLFAKKLEGEVDQRVPERFGDASLFRHKPRKQNPAYQTSNNSYGLKAPSQQEMPMAWSGIKGDFTHSFHQMMPRTTGFASSRTSSRVHKAYDDF